METFSAKKQGDLYKIKNPSATKQRDTYMYIQLLPFYLEWKDSNCALETIL